VLVEAIAPDEDVGRNARRIVEAHAQFLDVHVDASAEACSRRDPKGRYRQALRRELPQVTGISDPYERPGSP